MTPLDTAWHDWADANEGAAGSFECFAGGWHARAAEVDAAIARRDTDAGYWKHRLLSAEAERDRAMMTLATTEYERAAFKRQRDELARALLAAREVRAP